MNIRRLEHLLTGHLLLAVVVAVFLVLLSGAMTVALTDLGIEVVAIFVDSIFKAVALLAGAGWALNRYFVLREDAPQLRVDEEVDVIPASAFPGAVGWGLLLCRLDIINTGRSLIHPFQQFLKVEAVQLTADGTLNFVPLHRWPDEGMHLTGRIEPGSWSALNFELPLSASVTAIRIYVEFKLSDDQEWTWHKSFNLTQTNDFEAAGDD